MFDESRYFAQGNSVRAFDTRFGRLGMLICEDFWHVSPAYLLWLDGADVLILNSSSPSRGLNESDRLGATRWVEMVNQACGSMFTARTSCIATASAMRTARTSGAARRWSIPMASS